METKKLNFFKRVIISIKDFEKYDIFALESPKESLKYLFLIILIFSVIATFAYSYKIINEGIEGLVNQVEELDGIVEMSTEEMQEIIDKNHTVFCIITFFTVLFAYFSSTLFDAIMLGVLGIIVARIVGMKIKYKATFNIGVYALTLPIILQLIYLVVNLLTGFNIKYFQWMYATISYIYVVVAILMIKTEFVNQQVELMKLKLEQEKIRQEIEEQQSEEEKKKEENKEKPNPEKDDKKKEKQEDGNLKGEPEGNNA